jgi:hypothetical protein
MKKTNKTALLGTAMVALSALPAQYAAADQEAIQARANVVSSNLVIDQDQSLDFGTFTAVGAGSVDVFADGSPTSYNGVNEILTSSPSEAIVRVRGAAGPNIIMQITDTSVPVANLTAQTMVVNQFHIRTNAGGVVETFPLTANTMFVPIGATLSVGAGQAPGTYTGAFTVQAVYQ